MTVPFVCFIPQGCFRKVEVFQYSWRMKLKIPFFKNGEREMFKRKTAAACVFA